MEEDACIAEKILLSEVSEGGTTREVGCAAASAAKRPWWALSALCLGFYMVLVDVTIVSVAQEAIMTDLQADLRTIVWVNSAALLMAAVPLLLSGRLGDIYGPGRVYLAGLIVFTAASAWCGCASSIEMLIAARAVQGCGSALISPQAITAITHIFPRSKLGTAIGIWGISAGLATLVGPIAGGILVDNVGWRGIFFVNVPVGVIAIGMSLRLLPPFPRRRMSLDMRGVLMSGAGLSLVVWGLIEGQQWHWDSRSGVCITTGVLLWGVFLWWESVGPRFPLMPLSLLKVRNFTVSLLVITGVSFAVNGFLLPVVLYLQFSLSKTPLEVAWIITPMALVSGILSPWVGRLADRWHPRTLIGLSTTILGAGLGWLAWEMHTGVDEWKIMIPIAVIGIGASGTYAPISAAATRNVASERVGAASGVYNAARMVGAVLGTAMVGAVMQYLVERHVGVMAYGERQPSGALSGSIREDFARVMGESLTLCIAAVCCAAVCAWGYKHHKA